MDDLDAIERELGVAREHDDNVARARLIPQALALPAAEPFRAEYLDELAYAYAQLGRFDEAVDAMRKALDAGWDGELDDHPSARAVIADLLLCAGRGSEAERAWREAELERPRDPRVHRAAGNAYANVGLYGQAFQWRSRGLELALALADPDEGELLWLLAEERAEGLSEPDELQRRAEETVWEAAAKIASAPSASSAGCTRPSRPPHHRLNFGRAWSGCGRSSLSVSCAAGPASPVEQNVARGRVLRSPRASVETSRSGVPAGAPRSVRAPRAGPVGRGAARATR